MNQQNQEFLKVASQSESANIVSFEEATKMVHGNRVSAWRIKEMLGQLLTTIDPNQDEVILPVAKEPESKQFTMPEEISEASREMDRTFSVMEDLISEITRHIKAQ